MPCPGIKEIAVRRHIHSGKLLVFIKFRNIFHFQTDSLGGVVEMAVTAI